MRWDQIPFNEQSSAADKAKEFDLQIAENGGPTPAELEKMGENTKAGCDDCSKK